MEPAKYASIIAQGYEEEMNKKKSPKIDPKKAKEIQDSSQESGFQPDKWLKNLKEGLGK